jgi:UDP-N-acetylmuramoyl-tripeptide--D-alanyl-D-alanine ligase
LTIKELYELYEAHPSVQTDTRKLQAGDIFFALKGPNFDGNAFALAALEMGAAYAVIDNPTFKTDHRCLLVDDTLTALQQLAKEHRQRFNIPFLAITGSNGKTTTKELITAVLHQQYVTYATEGNLNNHIGVPLTLLKIKDDAAMAVIEMGANHQREIAAYCEIALPNYALITNCGKAHLEGFGGIEGVRKGKGELYDHIREHKGMVFRNADLDYLEGMAHDIARQITYGATDEALYAGEVISDGVMLTIRVKKPFDLVIETNLVGEYNFANVMSAVSVGSWFNVEPDDIKFAIESYTPGNSRSQWLEKGSNRIIMDAYNANPTSMRAAIVNFSKLAGLPNKTLWIGAMKEMGAEEQEEHMELVRLIDEYRWHDVILVGNEFKDIHGAQKWFATSAEAAEYIRKHRPENASILIKGSRGSKMELMAEAL